MAEDRNARPLRALLVAILGAMLIVSAVLLLPSPADKSADRLDLVAAGVHLVDQPKIPIADVDGLAYDRSTRSLWLTATSGPERVGAFSPE